MSWLFSRALVAAYSEAISWVGEPSAQSRSSHQPQAYSWPGKTTAPSRLSRSGMTFAPLMADRGAGLLTWFRAVSHARTYPSPAVVTGSTASDPASGWKWPASFVKYDPASRSWRTRQCSLQGGLTEFSETWPSWGSMLDGECSPLAPLVPHMHEKECSSWPTPCARDYRGVHRTERGLQRRQESKRGIPLNEAVGGLLNPPWVEWLMGWPAGWTAFEPLETGKYREWRQWHGAP
jgi:hypothetical protein